MKVRMLTVLGTPDGVFAKGDVVELDSGNAKALVKSGQAEPVGRKPADTAEKRGPGRPRKI